MNKVTVVLSLAVSCFLFLGSTASGAEKSDREDFYNIDLERIVVTPSKIPQEYKHATQNISIITKEDIEAKGITEFTEILDFLPSVDIIEFGSSGSTRSVHTRGVSSRQVITLIDGRIVNTPRDGETDFNQVPLSNIERVEVLRGPASNMYGAGAVGGVINIITKTGSKNAGTQILNKFGSFNTKLSSLSHGDKVKDFDYFVSYDYLASHGHRDNADHLSNNINTKFGYELDKDNRINLSSGYYNSEVGTPGKVTNIDLDDRQEAFKQYIDLTYNGKMLEGQNMVFKLFHNSDRLEFIESYIPLDKDTHHTKVYGMDAQFSQELYGVFRPSIGLSYQEHRLNSSASSKHEYDLKGINFESEIKVFDSGSLKFGARWDDYSNFGDKISPSASFNYWLSDGVKLHALAAKAFRAPTFNDLYWPREDWGAFGGVEGNQNLSPEKAVSFESGISGYFMGSIKTDLTFFRTRFRDLIEWSVDNALWWRPGNVSLAVIEGAELEAEVVLKDHLKAEFNYTYLKAKNRTLGKWLIYRPRHMYKLRLVYSPVPKYELGLSSIFKTKRFANESNTSILEHYAILNSNFTYKINDSTQVLLEVKNLFDRQYEEEKDYPVPGRAFYTGVRLKF